MFCKRAAHHLEGVQLLLDLLSQHRRQAVARSNFAATVVLLARPRLEEDNSGAKGGISLRPLGCDGCAFSVLAEPESRHKIIFAAYRDSSSPPVSVQLLVRRARRAGAGRIGDGRDAGNIKRGALGLGGPRRWARRSSAV